MIDLAPGTKVFLACRPIDLRAGFNGLAAKVQQVIERNPFDGSLFIFRGKRGDYFKAIYWDASASAFAVTSASAVSSSSRRSSSCSI